MPSPAGPRPPQPDLARLCQAFDECRPRLLAMLRRRIDPALVRRIDPEELVQETFVAARRRCQDFPGSGPLPPYWWFCRLARDCLIEAWRREARGPRDYRRDMPWPEHSSVALGLGLVAGGKSPSSDAGRNEIHRLVHQAVNGLPENDRDILGMHYFEGLSLVEIARVLDIQEGTARVRHLRALKRLKKALDFLNPPEGSSP